MRRTGRHRSACLGLAVLANLLMPFDAGAQASGSPASKPPRWEISVQGGYATGSATPDGLSTVPPAGESFLLADAVTPTRAVSSWSFGDGTALLNQILQLRGIGQSVTALHAPGWPAASRRAGPQVGARIAWHAVGSMWLEWGVDIGLDPIGFGGDAKGAVGRTRESFESAFAALANSSGAIAASSVTSSADYAPAGRRVILSSVVHHRSDRPGLRPFLLAGMGVAATGGDPGMLTLTNTYRLTPPGQAAIEEVDTVRLRYSASSSLVWIVGGGVIRDLTPSTAYRVEARLLASTTKLTGTLEAAPSRTTASPGGAIVLNGTNPGVQFSSSGIRPTLSGTAHQRFEAFKGDGRALQWVVSASYVKRF